MSMKKLPRVVTQRPGIHEELVSHQSDDLLGLLSHCTPPIYQLHVIVRQWRRQNFVTGKGSEVWVGGLEYEVPQKLTHLLQCIGNLYGLVRYDFNRLAVYLSVH